MENTHSLVEIKYFQLNWSQYLGDCEILLNANLIKPN